MNCDQCGQPIIAGQRLCGVPVDCGDMYSLDRTALVHRECADKIMDDEQDWERRWFDFQMRVPGAVLGQIMRFRIEYPA